MSGKNSDKQLDLASQDIATAIRLASAAVLAEVKDTIRAGEKPSLDQVRKLEILDRRARLQKKAADEKPDDNKDDLAKIRGVRLKISRA